MIEAGIKELMDEIQPWHRWMNPATHKKEEEYGINDEVVQEFFENFERDPREWKFMLVCLTPCVSTDAGAYNVAEIVAKKYPGFMVLVKSAEGIRRFRCVQGIVTSALTGYNLQETINGLDTSPGGPRTPVIEVTLAMSMRGSSERSNRRVPTHMICALTAWHSTADVLQIFTRCGGPPSVKDQRRANGYDCVKLLTKERDYDVLKGLDNMMRSPTSGR